MRRLLTILALLLVTGCASTDFSPGKSYRVTGGYRPNSGAPGTGDEFFFSLIPPAGVWGHTRQKPWFKTNWGYIEFENPRHQRISFNWIWKNEKGLRAHLASMPHLAPWLYGPAPNMQRIPYSPSEDQIESGDWFQPGYRQDLWHQFRYLGNRPYYCLSALAKSREGLIEFGGQKRTPYNAYWYTITCPFKLTDGRHAGFTMLTTFSLTDDQLRENPNRIDENISYIDKMLKPTWSSLVVMPQAYQFEPPSSASVPQP